MEGLGDGSSAQYAISIADSDETMDDPSLSDHVIVLDLEGITSSEDATDLADDKKDSSGSEADSLDIEIRSSVDEDIIDQFEIVPSDIESTIDDVANESGPPSFSTLIRRHETEADLDTLYPPSLWAEAIEDVPLLSEEEILSRLSVNQPHGVHQATDVEGQVFLLDEFCIYRGEDAKRYPGQYEHLIALENRFDKFKLHLDGTTLTPSEKKYKKFQHAQIKFVHFGGLMKQDLSTCKNNIYVQTVEGANCGDTGAWYKLTTPANKYQSHFEQSLSLADLLKHILCFIDHVWRADGSVQLCDFRNKFFQQLQQWHGSTDEFQLWHKAVGNAFDFTSLLTKNADVLWNHVVKFVQDQAARDIGYMHLLQAHVWTELGFGRERYGRYAPECLEKTTVTQNVYRVFNRAFPQWGPEGFDLLKKIKLSSRLAESRKERQTQLGLLDSFPTSSVGDFRHDGVSFPAVDKLMERVSQRPQRSNVVPLVGHIVLVRQATGSGTGGSYEFHYALVKNRVNDLEFKVIWLIRPSQTICCAKDFKSGVPLGERAFYPNPTQLFYSDRCNCNTINRNSIYIVLYSNKTEIGDERTTHISISMRYLEARQAIVTAKEGELDCTCQKWPRTPEIDPECASSLTAGPAPTHISTMSLFSGCGMFDNGLEAQGLFRADFAIDLNPDAMRSYEANHKSRDKCQFETGSVNRYLRAVIEGDAPYQQYDAIVAGCPCQGFSINNLHKENETSQQKSTLLASTLSYVEVYLPAFVLIENVPGMENCIPSACSQVVSFLVALGYQVQKKILKESDFGGNTIRRRVFILAAAPNFELPKWPEVTHGSHPKGPPVMTASIATNDLGVISNDLVINLKDPDHIPLERLKVDFKTGLNLRDMIRHIPKTGKKRNLLGVRTDLGLSISQKRWITNLKLKEKDRLGQSISHILCRIDPARPFPTVTTKVCGLDTHDKVIHWGQDRVISLKEVRRAQGVPDDYILIGSQNQRLKQVGNSVAWNVAGKLGKVMSEAWIRSFQGDSSEAQKTLDAKRRDIHIDSLSTLQTRFLDDGRTSSESLQVTGDIGADPIIID